MKIYESLIYRQPPNSKTLIERMLNLNYNSIQCFNRIKSQSKALFTIPIDTIKSVETVSKNVPKNN